MDKAEGKWRQRDKRTGELEIDTHASFFILAPQHAICVKDDTPRPRSRLELAFFSFTSTCTFPIQARWFREKRIDLIALKLLMNPPINSPLLSGNGKKFFLIKTACINSLLTLYHVNTRRTQKKQKWFSDFCFFKVTFPSKKRKTVIKRIL